LRVVDEKSEAMVVRRMDFMDLDFIKIFTTCINGRKWALDVNVKNMDMILRDGMSFDGSSIEGLATANTCDDKKRCD
jgi:glutamine synthetase